MPGIEDCHGPASKAALAGVRETVQLLSPPPPLFRLAERLDVPIPQRIHRAGTLINRRSDSGVIEIKTPGIRLSAMAESAATLEQTIIQVAAFEDQRTLQANAIAAAIGKQGRVQTLVNLPENNRAVAVLGPGGAIIGSDGADGLEIAVVIRHREQSLPSTWRKPEAVIEELFTGFGIPGSDISPSDVRLRFGYFELSKYDRQSTMRPVFLAVLDLKADETGVPYRFVAVAAATNAPGVAADEGLGSWGV